jgi:molybdate transport system substrate-binding protein
VHSETIVVFAAGSLRAPFTELAKSYRAAGGEPVTFVFGASGLLRERIAGGERADVFASANLEHPQALLARGWSSTVERFARNRMCLLAAPGVPLRSQSVLDVMFDPGMKLGTSTPKADPSGDYAFEVFQRADTKRKGAYDTLSRKALQLMGGAQAPAPQSDRSVYTAIVNGGTADVFLTYCTNAKLATVEEPSLHYVNLPPDLDVGADYGLAVWRDAPAGARAFADFVLSSQGQQVLAQYGFAAR